MKSFILLLLLYTLMTVAFARDPAIIREFRRLNACPSTQQHRGACPGYQVDHRIPLCLGGSDTISNLRWLPTSEHRAKTRYDIAYCAHIRKNGCPLRSTS